MSLSSFSSMGHYVSRVGISAPPYVPPPGMETISTDNLMYFYDYETVSVSGSTIKNGILNGTHDATLFGTNPIQTTTFRNGSGALNCSNTKYARLTNATNFHSTANTVSICFKFRLTAVGGYPCLFQVLNNANGAISQIQIYGQSPTTMRFVSFSPSYTEFNISTSIALNTWYSVVVTKNGNAINGFLNGVASGSVNNATNFLITTNATNRWVSGIDFNQQGHVFNGFIDDFRIYNRVITGAEITTLHNTLS